MEIKAIKFGEKTISFDPEIYVHDQQEANNIAASLIHFADKKLNEWGEPEIIFKEKNIMKILPVIHIKDEDQAISEAELIINSGCDGFWLINHNGNDNLTLSLASILSERYPNNIVGVNLLSQNPFSAIDSAIKFDLKYLWLDYAGVHSKDQNEILLTQQKLAIKNHGLNIFAGTAFKYQQKEENPVKATKIALSNNLTVTTSGSATGCEADLNKIELMSEAADGELALASGLTIDNIEDYHPYVKYAMVATGISKDQYYIDHEKLNIFVNKVKTLNSN